MFRFMKRLLLFALIIFSLERFCFQQTAGFREEKILSHFPYDLRWATEPPSEEIHRILDQPFHYLGHGGTTYCFASEDDKYVIKFFKHQHMKAKEWPSVPSFLEPLKNAYLQKEEAKNAHKRIDFLFSSCKIAYEELREETGLVHLQLNKSKSFEKPLILYDKIGALHRINLNETEFVIQKKADLFFPKLQELLRKGEKEKVKAHIDSLFLLLQKRYQKGLSDRDPHVAINFGMVDNSIVEIDIGSFTKLPSFQLPSNYHEELQLVADELKEWLAKQAPDLVDYVDSILLKDTS